MLKKWPLWLLGVFVVSFMFRLVGIAWGLPNENRLFSLHPDEPINLGVSQQVNPFAGQFDPKFYNYGTLYFSLLRVTTDVVNAYGGTPSSAAEQINRYTLAGRIWSALAGAGLACVTFALLRRKCTLFPSLLGAGVIAFSPGLSVHSRFLTVDMLAAFFVAWALYWGVVACETSEAKPFWKAVLLCGILSGLAAGTKYTGILALVGLAGIAWLPETSRLAKASGLALGSALLTFIATTPGILINPTKFWADFQYELNHSASGHGTVFQETAPGFLYHLGNLGETFSIPILLISLLGVGVYVKSLLAGQHRSLLGIVVFGLLTYLLIGRAEVKFLRYVFPLSFGIAFFFGWATDQLGMLQRARFAWVASLLAVVGFGGGGLAQAVNFAIFMAAPDPRDFAGEYLKAKGAPVGLVSDPWFYSPTLYPEIQAPRSVPFAQREELRVNNNVLRFTGEPPVNWDPRLLDELKPTYVVYSSFEFDDLERLGKNPKYQGYDNPVTTFQEFFRVLNRDYGLDQTFGKGGPTVHDLMYIRPYIVIWKRKQPDT